MSTELWPVHAGQIEVCLQEWELAHPDSLALLRDDGQFFGFQNAGRGALQRHTSFVFVPAVREASLDAADGKSSAIGRLLEIVVRSAILQRKDVRDFQEEVTARYRALVAPANMPELGELANRLTVDLKSLYRDAAVGLTWRDVADIAVPLPAADVSLSDEGFGGPVDRQGHGLQRAFVFTLLQHLAKTSHQPSATEGETTEEAAQTTPPAAPSLILAIEEPELYQHPTKQRHLASVLRGLSTGSLPGATGPTQIIFGSHSPMFVAMDRADEVRLARRSTSTDSKFKHARLWTGHRWWLPMIGLYTGVRINEAAQLKLTDVIQESGVWCIRMDRPAFRRHSDAIIDGNDRGVYGQQQAVHG